ncbi:GPI mannosyltransferase 1 [Ascosphaera atra]|nr:GPI mannosyltransferase 1 [Ascosphaera atra]
MGLSPFTSTRTLLTLAALLRVVLFFYGLYQDAHFPAKYTDIDYLVFTDAARYVSKGESPYARATYRYTPILAWLLLPTAMTPWLFSFGKALFAAGDILAGWLLIKTLRRNLQGGDVKEKKHRALKHASLWLLNPMVAVISTRGSSEGLLGVLVVALLWAAVEKRVALAGCLLGFGVHFKIYPFVYGMSILWYLDEARNESLSSILRRPWSLFNASRVKLLISSLATFAGLNVLMYTIYGFEFLQHTYLHHLTRVDHRHNFSPYNLLLHLSSSNAAQGMEPAVHFESLAFIPQLGLSAVVIPLVLAKRELAGCMLAQSFAFVAFNKVCTSQYFLWYLIFLPLYLPYSTFLANPFVGLTALAAWIVTQALWLQQAFNLEFLGESTFTPGLFSSSIFFFLANAWILGVIVDDVGNARASTGKEGEQKSVKA